MARQCVKDNYVRTAYPSARVFLVPGLVVCFSGPWLGRVYFRPLVGRVFPVPGWVLCVLGPWLGRVPPVPGWPWSLVRSCVSLVLSWFVCVHGPW